MQLFGERKALTPTNGVLFTSFIVDRGGGFPFLRPMPRSRFREARPPGWPGLAPVVTLVGRSWS